MDSSSELVLVDVPCELVELVLVDGLVNWLLILAKRFLVDLSISTVHAYFVLRLQGELQVFASYDYWHRNFQLSSYFFKWFP